MKRRFAVLPFLALGLLGSAAAQRSAATTARRPAASAGSASAESALHVRIAVISLQMAVAQTNEGQRIFAGIEKKYEPRQAQLKTQSDEIDALTKELQAKADTLSEAERDSRSATIEAKQKQLETDVQSARSDFQQEVQEGYSALAPKVYDVLADYAKEHGYTLVLDVSSEDSPVLWAADASDITKQVTAAYNLKSGIPAPAAAPAAPAPHAAGSAHP